VQTPRSASPSVAAALSALVPGSGQWYAGHRRRGLLLVAFTIVVALPVAVLGYLLFFGGGRSLALTLARPFFEHPSYLLLILAANGAVLAFRLLAALDAYWVAGGGFTGKRLVPLIGGIGILVAVVATPHVWAAQRNLATYDLLTYDYSVDPNQAAATTDVTSSTTSTTGAPIVTTSSVVATTTTVAATTTTTTALPPIAERRINILLLGGDAGPDRPGLRTDSIIVASVDPVTGHTAMLQLPRNQVDLPIPEDHPAYNAWECHCYPELANTIYQYGLAHPEQFPGNANSGAQAVIDIVGHLYGIDIHNYALVDLLGFVSVVDALGGLSITVTARIEDEQYTRPGGEEIPVLWPSGTYEMDGEEVLSYARVRRGTDDYHRMGRQRCVLEALAAQTDPVSLILGLPALVPAIQDSVLTDIPVREWPDFIDLAGAVDTTSIVSIRFMPNAPELVGTGTAYVAKNPQGYWVPIVPMIRDTVSRVLGSDPATASADLGIPPLGEICGVS
jgi:polyisoprenyl-teichoic acid--peptidoglycan teichoic acid transferase